MDFISMGRNEGITLNLKYCERCGGLWLRRKGQTGIYCTPCRARLAALLRERRTDGPPERKAPAPVRIDWLQGVAEMEVRA